MAETPGMVQDRLRAQVARLEGEKAALATALKKVKKALGVSPQQEPAIFWKLLGEAERSVTAALSDTGKTWQRGAAGRRWPEVREQAVRTIEELFSLADQIPAEVRERTEATLKALEVK